jgi:hypothetical protein
MRKFLRLVELERLVDGCIPKFFRSLIRIYVGNSGKGHKHHDEGVAAGGCRAISQRSVVFSEIHSPGFWHSGVEVWTAKTTGCQTFFMDSEISGSVPLADGQRLFHEAGVSEHAKFTFVRDWNAMDSENMAAHYTTTCEEEKGDESDCPKLPEAFCKLTTTDFRKTMRTWSLFSKEEKMRSCIEILNRQSFLDLQITTISALNCAPTPQKQTELKSCWKQTKRVYTKTSFKRSSKSQQLSADQSA